MKTMNELFKERDRQIKRCQKVCDELNKDWGEPRYTYQYDVCESGFTNFYFRLNNGADMLIRQVGNSFLDTEESKILSDYCPSTERLTLWDIQGLLKWEIKGGDNQKQDIKKDLTSNADNDWRSKIIQKSVYI